MDAMDKALQAMKIMCLQQDSQIHVPWKLLTSGETNSK